jgi:hypothetical protein
MSTDRTFITNEDGQSLHERFRVLEREIDELVYALYALTPEEIKLVEGAAK